MDNTHEYEIDLREYLRVIWKRKYLILLLFIITVVCTYLISNTLDPIYETSTTIMIQKNDSMQNVFSADIFALNQDKSSTYRLLLKTRRIIREVIRELDLRDENGRYISTNTLQENISVNSIPGSDLIEISMADPNPQRAIEVVTTLVKVFQKENTQINQSAMASARIFIEKQVVKVKKDLEVAEKNLLTYKEENNVILPAEEIKMNLDNLIEAESLLSTTEVEINSIETSILAIQSEMKNHDEKIIVSTTISDNPLIQKYQTQLTDLESRISGLKNKYTDRHPEIINLQTQIVRVQESLKKVVQKEIVSQTESANPIYQSLYQNYINLETDKLAKQAKLASLEQLVQIEKDKLKNLPERELELIRLERVAKVTAEIFTMLITRLEEIKISEAMLTSDIYVVDSAYLPTVPIKPNKKMLILVAGFLAVLVGLGLTILIEFMDTTIKTAEEIENILGVPVIGSIPDMENTK